MKKKEEISWSNRLRNSRSFFERFYRQASDLVNLYRSYTSDPYYVPKIYNQKLFNPRNHKAYNILWANTQILVPSVYQQIPSAQVSRRYNDNDPVGRVASEIVERCLNYEIKDSSFDDSVRMAIKCRFIMGQGTVWLRYEPCFYEDENGVTKREDNVCVDFVNFWDFLCSPARNPQEISWIGRRVTMSPDAFEQRFNKDPTGYITTFADDFRGDYPSVERTYVGEDVVKVWEIWDKPTKTVTFIADVNDEILEETHDFLGLEGFFPCPPPLYSDLAPGHLIPVPEYIQALSFAEIINKTSKKIEALTTAIKVVGVYDSSCKQLSNVTDLTFDGELIPFENYADLKSKSGGLNGVFEMIDFTSTVTALQALYAQRDQAKANLDELLGISDILRGSTDPIETATSQTIKSQYASIRLKSFQDSVTSFVGNVVTIMGDIVIKHFSPESLLKTSDFQYSSDGAQQNIQQAIQLIKDPREFGFRIDIETDSLVVKDQKSEQSARTEVTTMIMQFFQQVSGVPSSMIPLATQMLLFVLRAFPKSRELEEAIEQTTQALQQQAQQQEQQQNSQQQTGQPQQLGQAQSNGTVTNINVDTQKPLSPDSLLKSDTDIQKQIFGILQKQMDIRAKEGNPMSPQELEAITNNILAMNSKSDIEAMNFGKNNSQNA